MMKHILDALNEAGLAALEAEIRDLNDTAEALCAVLPADSEDGRKARIIAVETGQVLRELATIDDEFRA
jgi:hypothetical protein